jgi:hypothetical protein
LIEFQRSIITNQKKKVIEINKANKSSIDIKLSNSINDY